MYQIPPTHTFFITVFILLYFFIVINEDFYTAMRIKTYLDNAPCSLSDLSTQSQSQESQFESQELVIAQAPSLLKILSGRISSFRIY